MLTNPIDRLCRAIADSPFGDHLLSPPPWTARVGQKWDTHDVKPYNLFNVLWVTGQRVFHRGYGD